MRTIKFRAWDKENKRIMNWVDQIHWGNTSIESIAQTTPLESHKRKGVNIELMQFTGLHDKNGVEIYEGDIVKHDYGFGHGKGIVQYLAPEYTLSWDNTLCNEFLGRIGVSIEVIGNIYQNSELLK